MPRSESVLPTSYRAGDIEVAVEPRDNGFAIAVRGPKEAVFFLDQGRDEILLRAKASVLADMIRKAIDKERATLA